MNRMTDFAAQRDLPAPGLRNGMDENPGTFPASFPMSQIAIYIGWYTEMASAFHPACGRVHARAFAYHLTLIQRGDPSQQTSTGRAAAGKSATITMGCVAEPYLTGTRIWPVFAARFILRDSPLEKRYASQRLSWQTTVVGDPLYLHLEKNLDTVHTELSSARASWSNGPICAGGSQPGLTGRPLRGHHSAGAA